MGRRSKQKTGGASGASKKTKNIFKVNDVKQKKKPKEVQGKLKKVNSQLVAN